MYLGVIVCIVGVVVGWGGGLMVGRSTVMILTIVVDNGVNMIKK